MDKYIGKVVLVILPDTKRPRYRWIVKKRPDGRYISKIPKMHVLLRELQRKRKEDFGEEVLLPVGAIPYSIATKKARKHMTRPTRRRLS